MANIFLSVPILGKPELKMMYSMYKSILSSGKHQVRVYYNENDSLISRVRNVHMSTFYYDYPECDYFMSIDSDLEILNAFPDNNIFNKLVEHDLDFVGGLYSIKKPHQERCSSIPMDNDFDIKFDTGLKEMRWLSSGCWCVKREVVKKMIDAYPELQYDGDDNAAGQRIHGLYIPYIYEMKKEDFPEIDRNYKKYISEDWAFCQRWLDIGGKVWADTSIVLRHYGKISYDLFNVEVQQVPTKAVGENETNGLQKEVTPPPAGHDLRDQ